MRLQLDGLTEDIHVTNEHLGPLETSQNEAATMLRELRIAQATTNTNLDTIMTWLEELSQ
jgi:endonuclease/exonuclease/phosphatase family metal-dependent hydrolase